MTAIELVPGHTMTLATLGRFQFILVLRVKRSRAGGENYCASLQTTLPVNASFLPIGARIPRERGSPFKGKSRMQRVVKKGTSLKSDAVTRGICWMKLD